MSSSAVVSRKSSVLPARSKVPDVRTYSSLKKEVGEALEAGRKRAQEAVEQEKTRTYWEVGQLIDAHVLQSGERGDYGKKVLRRLSEDLRTNQTLLYYALQFARAYENFPAPGKLTWSHYRALLPVKDEGLRKGLEAQAEEWGWSSRRLEEAVGTAGRKASDKSVVKNGQLPEVKPGEPHRYRLFRSQAPGANPNGLLIDLGFSSYLELPSASKRFFSEEIIRSEKKAGGNGTAGYHLSRVNGARETDLYFYRAFCEKVVDGDTVWMQVDLGFGVSTRQKLRLRGIDAPELDTEAGRKARKFLEAQLQTPEGVLIRTIKSDKYDRYLADIFAGTVHINGLMVSRALASRI